VSSGSTARGADAGAGLGTAGVATGGVGLVVDAGAAVERVATVTSSLRSGGGPGARGLTGGGTLGATLAGGVAAEGSA
jgi:hypothetical protein